MPINNSNSIHLKVKDHSVSGEEFQLIENLEFGFLETRPRPSIDELPNYYKSKDYISHTDAKRNLFEKLYHLVKKFSLKKKLKLINTLSGESKTLLDFGCGTGDFLQIAKEGNWNIFGIEPNPEARVIGNRKTNTAVFDTDQLAKFEPHSFDIITLWHVLEHVPNLEQELAVFNKLLKPNGRLVVAVPNYKSYDATYYKSYWAAYDVPRHLWHFKRDAIKKLCLKNNFEVENIKPMLFDAYYVSLLSEKYKSGFMNPIRAFWIASVSNLKSIRSKEASSLIYIIKKKKTVYKAADNKTHLLACS